MPLRNPPSKCSCGASFTTNYALNCHRGGFVNARHDNIRDFEYKLLQNVCNDVEIEPQLQKVCGGSDLKSSNLSDVVRVDIRPRGFSQQGKNAFFFDVKANTGCDSQKEIPF